MKDLFQHQQTLPQEVKDLLVDEIEEGDYEGCAALSRQLEALGYSMKFGLDGVPFGLRRKKLCFAVFEDAYHRYTEIVVEDGSVCILDYNGEHMVATFFGNRILDDCEKISIEELSKGKVWTKSFPGRYMVDSFMIGDCLNWMVMFNEGFTMVKDISFEDFRVYLPNAQDDE